MLLYNYYRVVNCIILNFIFIIKKITKKKMYIIIIYIYIYNI